jgi:hypothetical protein
MRGFQPFVASGTNTDDRWQRLLPVSRVRFAAFVAAQNERPGRLIPEMQNAAPKRRV